MESKYKFVFDQLKDLKILLIGETILDEYYFVEATGRASKDPVISTRFNYSEKYPGGILATARHISNIVEKTHIITMLGEKKSNEGFVRNVLNHDKISYDLFQKSDSPTIIKRRYIAGHTNKIFKMEYINDDPINDKLETEITNRINDIIKDFDAVLIADFGHGLLKQKIINKIEKKAKYLAINVQTNSSNYGFNLVHRYPRADFLSLNPGELRILFQSRYEDLDLLFDKLISLKKYNRILLTRGKKGISYYDGKEILYSPALNLTPVDTIGAGDAVFSFSSIMSYLDIKSKILAKLSNAVGALAVNIVGNKDYVKVEDVFNLLEQFDEEELDNEHVVSI